MPVRQLVIQERVNNPHATLQQIGAKYGVTKERVRQILSSSELPTKHWRASFLCNNCFKEFLPSGTGSKLFCSNYCRKQYNVATLTCEECGTLFKISYGKLIGNVARKGQQHFYCSGHCKGKAAGRKYGFRVHHENYRISNHTLPPGEPGKIYSRN